MSNATLHHCVHCAQWHATHCTVTRLGQWEGQWSVLLIAAARLRECFSAPLHCFHLRDICQKTNMAFSHFAFLKRLVPKNVWWDTKIWLGYPLYRNLGIIMLSSSSASLASCGWLGLPFFRTGLSDRWMAVAATIPWPPMPSGGPMGGRLDPRGPYTTNH